MISLLAQKYVCLTTQVLGTNHGCSHEHNAVMFTVAQALNPIADAPPSRFVRQIGSYLQQQKEDGEYSLTEVLDSG